MNYFKIKDWVCVHRSPSVNIFQNQLTAQLAEEYVLEAQLEEIIECFQALESTSHPQLAKLLYLQKFTKYDEQSYSFSHFSIRLFSEFLQVRLGDIGTIPDHHLFNLIYQTLLGFQVVYHNIKPIKANPRNIGFNKKNQLKIVLYQDLAKQQQNQTHTQEEIVTSVIEVYRKYLSNKLIVPLEMNFTQALYFIGCRVNIEKNQQSVRKLHRKDPRFSMFQIQSRGNRESVQPLQQEIDKEFMNRQNFGPTQMNPLISRIVPHLSSQNSFSSLFNQNQRPNQATSLRMNIEQARTTQNNLSVIDDLIEIDSVRLPLELLDDKKPQYVKLNLIDNILTNDSVDEDLKRLCRVYKHAIMSDADLHRELKKANGRFQLIEREDIRQKISQIMSNKQKYQGLTNRVPTLPLNSKPSSDIIPQRNQRIKNIIQYQKLKMQLGTSTNKFPKPSFSPSKNVTMGAVTRHQESISNFGKKMPRFTEFKQQASKVLFDF